MASRRTWKLCCYSQCIRSCCYVHILWISSCCCSSKVPVVNSTTYLAALTPKNCVLCLKTNKLQTIYFRWKRYITIFQLIQFVTLFGHSLVFLIGYGLEFEYAKCGYPWQFSAIGCALLYIPFFFMFTKFYAKSYVKEASSKKTP